MFTVDHLMTIFQQLENQLKMKEQQVQELESQADHLRRIEPDKVDDIEKRRALVAERSVLSPGCLGPFCSMHNNHQRSGLALYFFSQQ